MTASPKPSFRAPWRVGDAMAGRGNAGWTTWKGGHPYPCQAAHNGLPQKKSARESPLNCPSCPPTSQSVKALNWTKKYSRTGTRGSCGCCCLTQVMIMMMMMMMMTIWRAQIYPCCNSMLIVLGQEMLGEALNSVIKKRRNSDKENKTNLKDFLLWNPTLNRNLHPSSMLIMDICSTSGVCWKHNTMRRNKQRSVHNPTWNQSEIHLFLSKCFDGCKVSKF